MIFYILLIYKLFMTAIYFIKIFNKYNFGTIVANIFNYIFIYI